MRARVHRLGLRSLRGGVARVALIGAALLPDAPALAREAAPSDSIEAAVRRLLQDQQAAWNRGDLEAFMAGYWESPDLVFSSGGRVQRGWRTVLERYRATYGTGAELGRLTFSDLEVHPLGGDAAWALGRWELDLAGGRAGGVFTLVLRRLEGGWRIVHDHTSSGPDPDLDPSSEAVPGVEGSGPAAPEAEGSRPAGPPAKGAGAASEAQPEGAMP